VSARNAELLRLTEGFGIALAPIDVCRRELDNWTVGTPGASIVTVEKESDSFDEVVDFLSHLTHPATRHVMIPLQGATLFTNNLRDGASFADRGWHVSKRLHTRVARITNRQARFWEGNGLKERLAYEARILEIHDDGVDVRSVSCMNDGGRWVSHSSGTPIPGERGWIPAARKTRDRFTPEGLRTLAACYQLPYPDIGSFRDAGRFVLLNERFLHEDWQRNIEANACTPEQNEDPAFGYYRRGLTYVKHMNSHYESVIADFERAIRINPAYESLVAGHLSAARERLARK
jgi:hypothetical protein